MRHSEGVGPSALESGARRVVKRDQGLTRQSEWHKKAFQKVDMSLGGVGARL